MEVKIKLETSLPRAVADPGDFPRSNCMKLKAYHFFPTNRGGGVSPKSIHELGMQSTFLIVEQRTLSWTTMRGL